MCRLKALLPAAAALAILACAPRSPQTFRLIPQTNARVLVPPGVATADVARGTVTIAQAKGPRCTSPADAIVIERHGGHLRLTVARDALLQQPAGWLRQWSGELEGQGCIPAGTGLDLAMRILDSVPLDPSAAYRLLHGDSVQQGYVELGPENRLETQAPIVKAGTSPDTDVIETTSVTGVATGSP